LRGDTYGMDVLKGVGIAVGGTALGAVGGTAIGGIIGAAGSGAAVGTAIGAAAGIGYAAARKGKSVDLQNGSRLRIKLDQPAAIGSAY
jgi:outer membrane lipoprotein SlyB